MEPEVITFEQEKKTRNTIKYQEVAPAGQPPKVGALYVQKWYARDARQLRVTIERQ